MLNCVSAQPHPAHPHSRQRGLSRGLILLLATATGASVANLYYAQPLLHAIASTLHSSPATAALLVTASQIGYAAGLILLVPLGDLVDRRKLVTRMLLVCALVLVLGALAPTLLVLAIAVGIAGITSTVAQVLVPFASTLASEEERGRVVGQVMSGLLVGILVARTFSGLIAEAAGWRFVFAFAAVAMVVLAAALWRALPDVRSPAGTSYGRLLASVAVLIREEPLLRMRMVFGGLGMASFTVLWTTLALLLSQAPFHFGSAVIGLFGLAGVAGAGAAQAAGRAADSGAASTATGLFLLAIGAGWALLELGSRSVLLLVVGIAVLDLGIQGQHILNQTVIYARRPDARSRLTTAYMTGNFVCGAIASALAAVVWSSAHWTGVCLLGGGCSALALLVWVAGRVRLLPDVAPGTLESQRA
jgi:predicted MFS family arabinose efflux permease